MLPCVTTVFRERSGRALMVLDSPTPDAAWIAAAAVMAAGPAELACAVTSR